MSVHDFGFTTPATTMPGVPQDTSVSSLIRRVLLWLVQRMNVLAHCQQSPHGPFVIQMQSGNTGIANAFDQDRMGFRQDGSNFLVGPLDRTSTTATGTLIVQPSDNAIFCDATAGSFTLYLPSITSSPGRQLFIKKIDNTANTITVLAATNNFIEFVTNYTLQFQGDNAAIQNDGLNHWFILHSTLKSLGVVDWAIPVYAGTTLVSLLFPAKVYLGANPPTALGPFDKIYIDGAAVIKNGEGISAYAPNNTNIRNLINFRTDGQIAIGDNAGTTPGTDSATQVSIHMNTNGEMFRVDSLVGPATTPLMINNNGTMSRVVMQTVGGVGNVLVVQ